MTYYFYINNNKITGAGICKSNFLSLEVDEETYLNFAKNFNYYVYDGEKIILNPNYEEEQAQIERERLDKLSLTKREVFLALYKSKGITPEQIKTRILNPEALIEFEYANEYFRGNPLINLIGEQLGYSSDDLDYLFEHKELPEEEIQESEEENAELV